MFHAAAAFGFGTVVMDLEHANLYGLAWSLTLGGTLTYVLCKWFYRLYLHPLANFPGPKLAAISTWYEGYYDVIHKGQYIFQVEKLHKKYGMFDSIIYINPSLPCYSMLTSS